MEKGENFSIKYIKRELGPKKCDEIDIFLSDILKREYLEITAKNIDTLKEYTSNFLENITDDELLELRSYTGYYYKFINAILRNNWNYDINGKLDENLKNDYYNRANKIYEVINKFPNIPMNFKTYRGVNLEPFKKYGITTIEELMFMNDKLFYEDAFTSTSVIKENCYFNKELECVNFANILIEYYIPEESKDGALLINDFLSYSKGQTEYVINRGCLTKIFDVIISEDKKTAIIKAALIPKSLWNKYENENENNLKK